MKRYVLILIVIFTFSCASDEKEKYEGVVGGLSKEADRACGMTSTQVGKVVTLSTKAHGVSGVAEIIDDCTIQFTNFNFDGNAIETAIYIWKNAKYDSESVALTNDINGTTFTNASFKLTLPSTVNISDFDGITVWCIPASLDMGSGQW